MKTLQLVALVGVFFSGCVVVPYHPGRPRAVRAAVRGGCPPAHHWNGLACVHNGNARGRYR